MRKIRGWHFFAAFTASLVLAVALNAGDITGALSVARPDHAVVYVEKAPGAFPGGHAAMDQKNKVFLPFVLPIVQGTTVDFHNSDNLQHNVFGVGADDFNLGTYGMGATKGAKFQNAGEVDILCNVHPEMAGYILVLQNPYFAKPDGGGKFRIGKVPPGDYILRFWYEGQTKKQNVKVPASGDVSASF